MKILIPFTPHIAYECLEKLKAKEIKTWPKIDNKLIQKKKSKWQFKLMAKLERCYRDRKRIGQISIEKLCKKNEEK